MLFQLPFAMIIGLAIVDSELVRWIIRSIELMFCIQFSRLRIVRIYLGYNGIQMKWTSQFFAKTTLIWFLLTCKWMELSICFWSPHLMQIVDAQRDHSKILDSTDVVGNGLTGLFLFSLEDRSPRICPLFQNHCVLRSNWQLFISKFLNVQNAKNTLMQWVLMKGE